MRKATGEWFAAALALAALATGQPTACGQDDWPGEALPLAAGPPLPGALALGPDPVDAGPGADLARRVEELEAAMKKAADEQIEAKAKAAARPSWEVFGRLQIDVASFSQDAASRVQVGNAENGFEFRRARLGCHGLAFEVVEYQIEVDFASGDPDTATRQSTAFKDTYLAVTELPLLGNVRVGHFKEPFGLEQLTSDNFPTFLERSLGDEGAFVPARNLGLMAFNHTPNQRATWAIGVFAADSHDQPAIYQNDDGGYALTLRGTWLPWYDEPSEGRRLLHIGLAYSFRDAADDVVGFRVRPEAHLGPQVVNLTLHQVEDWQLLGAEAALVYGPLSLQSEFYGSVVDRGPGMDRTFTGCYAYVGYFLTGESRPYRRSAGVFDRVRPNEEFFRLRGSRGDIATGKGAWEVGYRFSYVDFLDGMGTTNGAGRVADHTVGVNWYLNPYARVMFNYVNSRADRVTGGTLIRDGHIDIFELRAQVDF
jgi:phosphate-selective porin OprO/OprP